MEASAVSAHLYTAALWDSSPKCKDFPLVVTNITLAVADACDVEVVGRAMLRNVAFVIVDQMCVFVHGVRIVLTVGIMRAQSLVVGVGRSIIILNAIFDCVVLLCVSLPNLLVVFLLRSLLRWRCPMR